MQHKTTSRSTGTPFAFDPRLLGTVRDMTTLRSRALREIGQGEDDVRLITTACDVTERLNAGTFWNYQANDLKYHDYQHTLQASWAYLDLVAGMRRHDRLLGGLGAREVILGFTAILLHDTGYLKAVGDDLGTGAKYTSCHVLRSCAIAASLLPAWGCIGQETEDVVGAIRCTGLAGRPATATFSTENARTIACLVATADYLGQMAAPEYPEKLPHLYAEFAEADTFNHVPVAKRQFNSLSDLLASTPGFWSKFVLPKLDHDFAGVHRFLRAPASDAPNPYFTAIERNLEALASLPDAPNA